MSHYVDGFVIPLAKDKVELYLHVANLAGQLWMEHGALEFCESLGDDLEGADHRTFPQMAGTTPEETVVFSWITFKSREHRDEVNAKVLADPRMKQLMEETPQAFDCRRMAYGGFKTIVAF